MINRKLYCPDCGTRYGREGKLHPEDVRAGWVKRVVPIACAKCPPGLATCVTTHDTVSGQRVVTQVKTDHDQLKCDSCATTIPNGTRCVAVTMWRAEPEPGPWEREYSVLCADCEYPLKAGEHVFCALCLSYGPGRGNE